jgi:hypothetical protein
MSTSGPLPSEITAPIEAARALFRIARNPRGDASWPIIRARLANAERLLLERDYPGGGPLHDEIARYLGLPRVRPQPRPMLPPGITF